MKKARKKKTQGKGKSETSVQTDHEDVPLKSQKSTKGKKNPY